MGSLKNKTAVVTGGNSGIGYESAKLFRQHDARVLITGRDPRSVQKAATELGVYSAVAEQSAIDDLANLSGEISTHLGKIDILFLNAGLGYFLPVEAATAEHYDSIMNANVRGLYFTVQKLLPLINDGGSIIINSSVNAVLGMAASSVYSMGKAALLSLNRVLATELGPRRIRVNAILPGPIDTPAYGKTGMDKEQLDHTRQVLESKIILKRYGTPEEVAQVVRFLASEESSFVNASEITVDGGLVNYGIYDK